MGVDLRDPVVRDAIGLSHLAEVPEPLLAPLLADAMRLVVPAGSLVRREGERGAHVELVLSGLLRIFVSSPDGRTLTVRYCRPGALVGVVSLYRPGYVMPGGTQALLETRPARAPRGRGAPPGRRGSGDGRRAPRRAQRAGPPVRRRAPRGVVRDGAPAARPAPARPRRRPPARGAPRRAGQPAGDRRCRRQRPRGGRAHAGRPAPRGARRDGQRAASGSSIRTGSRPRCSPAL